MFENVLENKAEVLPRPLTDYLIDLPEAEIRLRLQMTVKVTENEEVRLRGANVRSYVDVTIPRRIEKTEKLTSAHYLPSKDETRLFLFATREAAADYIHSIREGRDELQRARDAWLRDKAEAETRLSKAREEAAALETAIAKAEAMFKDSGDNLAYTKAKTDLAVAERKIKDLKAKIAKSEPRPDMGSAIATQFGCDEIVTRGEIVEAVMAERERLLDRFRGLPDDSEVRLGRHTILDVAWKR